MSDISVPLSTTGRATVAALAMNRPLIVAIRQEETAHVHPTDTTPLDGRGHTWDTAHGNH